MPLVLVLGGTRSGKSRFAVQLARRLSESGGRDSDSPLPVTVIATAEPRDEEMTRRIRRHRLGRPRSWTVHEEPREVEGLLRELGPRPGVIVLDCLSLLISNWMEKETPAPTPGHEVGKRCRRLARLCAQAQAQVIVVSSEAGMGVVPAHPAGRLYRDLLGEANQILATQAREVYLVVAGIPLEVKSLSGRQTTPSPGNPSPAGEWE